PHTTLLFFPSLLPRPPRPTLFPYTTLFRSARIGLAIRVDHRARPIADEIRDALAHARLVERERRFVGLQRELGPRRADHHRDVRDRKSTRLNSSHLGISYAVFCLKKKKQLT